MRLHAIVDVDASTRAGLAPLEVARAFLAGGARLVQLRAKHLGSRAFLELADACVAVSGLAGAAAIIRAATPVPSLVPLLQAMHATFPQRTWELKAIWPEEHAALFTAAGFYRTELSQWQMTRPL